MGANDARRYICKIEIYAAAGHVDATELSTGSSLEAVINELKNANPDDIEDQTYRVYRFDLCESCRKIIQASPLGEKLAEGPIRRPPSSSANQ